jgi:hypothetical protein
MRRIVGGALALLVLLPAARALDEPKPAGTPAEQYKALEAEYKKSMADFMTAYRAAKTNEERQKLFKDKYPNPDKFAARFLKLAEEHPKDPAAVDALVWVFSNSRNPGKGGPREKAVGLVKREMLQSDKIAPLCEALGQGIDQSGVEALRAILDKSPKASVKAAACLGLGSVALSRARMAEQFKKQPNLAKAYEGIMGKEAVQEIEKKGAEGMKKEAIGFFERVVKDYPDAKDAKGRPLARDAKNKIDGILHPIEVGKAAPEVEGEDTDGKAFKLSDYKGKVVLLDFWGNW